MFFATRGSSRAIATRRGRGVERHVDRRGSERSRRCRKVQAQLGSRRNLTPAGPALKVDEPRGVDLHLPQGATPVVGWIHAQRHGGGEPMGGAGDHARRTGRHSREAPAGGARRAPTVGGGGPVHPSYPNLAGGDGGDHEDRADHDPHDRGNDGLLNRPPHRPNRHRPATDKACRPTAGPTPPTRIARPVTGVGKGSRAASPRPPSRPSGHPDRSHPGGRRSTEDPQGDEFGRRRLVATEFL